MKSRGRNSISALALVASAAFASAPAFAQDAAAPAQDEPKFTSENDIVVTARRREERLQDVPVSVTALSGDLLVDKNVRSVADLANLTPNLNVSQATGNRSSIVLNIRGQTQTNVDANLDPSVGIYVDGIYVAHLYGANTQLTDISDLQVLRGPQGTLFGRNTPGGALLINTSDPNMEGFSGLMRVTGGENGRRNFEGVINAVVVPDLLAIRGAAKFVRSDGYGRNVAAPFQRLADEYSDNYRVKLLFTPSSDLRFLLSAERFSLNEGSGIVKLTSFAASAATAVTTQSGGTDSIANYLNLPGTLAGISPLIAVQANSTKPIPNAPGTKTTVDQLMGRMNWDVSDAASLQLLGGYRRTDSIGWLDLDGTPYTIVHAITANDFKQYSAELVLNGHWLDNKLNYTTGLYWFHEKGIDQFQIQDTTAKAVFAQGSYSFSDQFSVTLGGRYSSDLKKPTATGLNSNFTCGVPVELRQDPAICAAQFRRVDNGFQYTASAEFKPVEDLLLYAKTTKGTRSGGFNVRAASPNLAAFAAFAPEEVIEYEIGLKSQFLDRRVTFNMALFYDDYKVIQRQATVVNVDNSVSGRVTSDAKGRVKGAEFELSVIPVDGLRLGGTLGLIDAKYTQFEDSTVVGGVVVVTDRRDEPFSRTPNYTYALNASYTRPFKEGEFNLRADWNYSDTFVGVNSAIRPGSLPFITQKGYGTLNLRGALSFNNGFELAAYASNVTNQHYILQSLDLSALFVNYMGGNREVGLEGTFRF